MSKLDLKNPIVKKMLTASTGKMGDGNIGCFRESYLGHVQWAPLYGRMPLLSRPQAVNGNE